MNNENITIDGKEYEVASLSDSAKYCIAQIQNLNAQTEEQQFRLAQTAAAKQVFEASLIKEVTEQE